MARKTAIETHADIVSNELEALRAITEGTAGVIGEEFFRTLVERLATAIGMRHVFVSEYTPPQAIRTLAFWSHGKLIDNIEYDLPGTPCQQVIDGGFCFYPSGLQKKYPETEAGIESYLGVPLKARDGRVLGHLCALDEAAMPDEPGAWPSSASLPPARRRSWIACSWMSSCASRKSISAIYSMRHLSPM